MPAISATTLSQFIRLGSCERYLWLDLHKDECNELMKKLGVTLQPLTPLLSDLGMGFEASVTRVMRNAGYNITDVGGNTSEDTRERLMCAPHFALYALAQARVEGEIGGWLFAGRPDLILTQPGNGRPRLTVVDVKASRRERVEHRIQVALYCHMLQQMMDCASLFDSIQGAVLRRETDGSLPSCITPGSLPCFDLAPYHTALHNLAIGSGSVLARVSEASFSDVSYHLGYKCDGCMYNGLCVADSSVRKDIAIIPYISLAERKALLRHGIRTLEDVVSLKTWPSNNPFPKELHPRPGYEGKVRDLGSWPLGPGLDRLVARAASVLHRYDNTTPTLPMPPNAPASSLPAGEDVIRVFIDAQHDYMLDRVYMIGALVAKGDTEKAIIRMTNTAPGENEERDLFVSWAGELCESIKSAVREDMVNLHFFVYDRYDQKVVLDGLKRHMNALSSIPMFYDLLTQTAALTQSMLSYLSDEVRERRNLGWMNQSLVRVAGSLGFDWKIDGKEFFRIFQARVFDDRRTLQDGTTVEIAARFNSQIPLEYAYSTWGLLPRGDTALDRMLLAPYRKVTRQDLLEFEAHRVRALSFIEKRLRPAKHGIQKQPVSAKALSHQPNVSSSLSNALVNFVFMEHHARVQECMRLYSLPITRRCHTGRAMMIKSETSLLRGQETATFSIEYEAMGLDRSSGSALIKLKPGTWCVLNPLEDEETGLERTGPKLASGRLCVVEKLDDSRITLRMMFVSSKNSQFKFSHWNVPVERGGLYTLDEMADDLLADKCVQACKNSDGNLLVRIASPDYLPGRMLFTGDAANVTRAFLDTVSAAESPNRLTAKQASVVGGYLGEPVFLIQGPPGTGKSLTLGWTVLSRLLALPDNRPRVVLVSSKTHNAISVVLEKIVECLNKLKARCPQSPQTRKLSSLRIYKLDGEADKTGSDHITPLSTYDHKALLSRVIRQDLTVIGATPGGVYNLVKYTQPMDWRLQLFDIVILDEASQMSLPEALLSCAFLKNGGQVVVAGDHRQMPPILAHGWEAEKRREAEEYQPYRSVFEYLLNLKVVRVGLDESFRLPKPLAELLARYVYSQDGIELFSSQTRQLPNHRHSDAFINAVLDPDYPIVVIEHAEQRSQQANHAEADIVRPLVNACIRDLRLDGYDGVGVVVPHRAQKALLSADLAELAQAGAIDTVERFQGGERDVILVSATVSDPDYALLEADFLMDANRLNVAISRPRRKLVVVGSTSLFRLLPSDPEVFEHASIWKVLRYVYGKHSLWTGNVKGVTVGVYGYRG